jgi:ABC-type sugar transport system permease subunit
VTIVPLQLVLGLAMAVALNQAIRGVTGVYRLIYFMPVVTTDRGGRYRLPAAAGNNGPVNNLLRSDLRRILGHALQHRPTGWAALASRSGRW